MRGEQLRNQLEGRASHPGGVAARLADEAPKPKGCGRGDRRGRWGGDCPQGGGCDPVVVIMG